MNNFIRSHKDTNRKLILKDERQAFCLKKRLSGKTEKSLYKVGMTRFELATTRPPDEYSKPG